MSKNYDYGDNDNVEDEHDDGEKDISFSHFPKIDINDCYNCYNQY